MKRITSMITRREFLGRLGGLAVLSGLPVQLLHATERPLIKKSIPASGESLPVIGVGSSRTFNVDLGTGLHEDLVEVMQTFFDMGGAVIDSSPMYGNAEAVIGQLLKPIKNKQALFAATKVWTDGKQAGIEQMQRSMQLMGVNAFDLMQIHNLRDWRVHLETLKQWKHEGKVRYIGITTSHGRFHDELAEILMTQPFDFVQLSYNIENRVAEQRLLPIAADRGIAVLVNRPFQRGSLFAKTRGKPLPAWAEEIDCKSWAQYFLKFIVSHPAVTCVIPATSKVKHMRDNMTAGFGVLPDAKMRQRMLEYYEQL